MSPAPRIRLAVAHYHLRRGGVTRVIEHALAALPADRFTIAVLAGEPPAGEADPRVRVVDGLGYRAEGGAEEGRALADRMQAAAREALGGPPDLWHIHNHALGKNPSIPHAVFRLAEAGARVLLQPHDFAEDGRPGMYRRLLNAAHGPPRLYPLAEHVHYAVLNDRDYDFLRSALGDSASVHFLPNAVHLDAPPAEPRPAGDRRLFLYPTRGIRRKNLGELLLWAAAAAPGDRFATTLAPENPEERPRYDAWVSFAGDLRLPVEFEVGADPSRPFAEVVEAADAFVTTSVAEGFGLAFLEPWLFGKPLAGRDLPEVTPTFRREGVDLGALYERLEVPVDWVGRDALRQEIGGALEAFYAAYGRTAEAGDVDRALDGALAGDRVDFGRLGEPLQRRVIERVARDAAARTELAPGRLDGALADAATVAANRDAVRQRFSLPSYGDRLASIYEGLLATDHTGRVEAAPADGLLDLFLAPGRFNLLRT